MKAIKASLIILGIILILLSVYLSTLIYPSTFNTITKNTNFIAEYRNVSYKINEFPEYSYIEFPGLLLQPNGDNATIILGNDASIKKSNIGLLTDGKTNYFAFSKEFIESGYYKIDNAIYHDYVSPKGSKVTVIELTEFTKLNQNLTIFQLIYKFFSNSFFIIGFSIMTLYALKGDLNSEGRSSFDNGKFDEAIRFYKNTMGIDPEDETGLVAMGNSLNINGKFDKARIFYDKAIELYPESTWALNAKGLGFKQINKYDEAIKCFEKSIQLDPKYSNGYYNIACTFSLMKDSDKAIQFLRKAIEISKTKYVMKAKNDKDFDPIRDNPEFIDIINFK